MFLCALCIFASAAMVLAQPRTIPKPDDDYSKIPPAPDSFETKYQGGIIGFTTKEQGTLKFDDVNERLVFFNKEKKEQFSINYDSMYVVYPSTNKVQSGTGRVISAIPILGAGLGGSLLKKQKNYLVIQFVDKDVDVQGVVNFTIDTNELLHSVIKTLGEKAELTRRGDSFIRSRKTSVDGN
jgi:hypothetical protein